MATDTFKQERHRKALTYTAIICGSLLLLFFLIGWKVLPPAPPVAEDLIEINLGNNEDGFGEEQPLIKGERSPEKETAPTPAPAVKEAVAEEKVTPDDNAEADAAPVVKVEKKTPKVKAPPVPAPVVTPTPKPQKPKIVYKGPGNGKGNGATEDNGYTMNGKTPGGKGDNGDPNGNKDSYGNTPGGKIGRARAIIQSYNYKFNGDLPKATVNALIKISPAGKATFIRIVAQGSTSTNKMYADAIVNYLKSMEFGKSDEEYSLTVPFNFKVNGN
jgi:hypothetical protein